MVCDRLKFFFVPENCRNYSSFWSFRGEFFFLQTFHLPLPSSYLNNGIYFQLNNYKAFLVYVANQPKRIRRSEMILNEPSLYNDSLSSLLCSFLLLTFSNHRKGMLIDPRCVSWAAGGWHGRWNWTRLEWFHGTFSLSRRLLISLSQRCRGRKVDIVFLSCVLSVLKHIQMCAALFLYNTRREQKENEKRIYFFFFIYSSLFFKGTRTESLSWRETLCVCLCLVVWIETVGHGRRWCRESGSRSRLSKIVHVFFPSFHLLMLLLLLVERAASPLEYNNRHFFVRLFALFFFFFFFWLNGIIKFPFSFPLFFFKGRRGERVCCWRNDVIGWWFNTIGRTREREPKGQPFRSISFFDLTIFCVIESKRSHFGHDSQ